MPWDAWEEILHSKSNPQSLLGSLSEVYMGTEAKRRIILDSKLLLCNGSNIIQYLATDAAAVESMST